jgi:hypothetical protein
MTDEERDLITRFIERVAGGQNQGQPLPPIDPEADRLIADLFSRYPEARYRITQTAMVQEHALIEAQNRINRLQWELQQARQAQAAGPAPQASPWGAAAPPQPQPRGFLSGLFGGGARPASPPPPPPYAPPPSQYPPGYNPGLFQQQGPGFFGSALRTAAGVAGGVLAADALMNLFSGSHGGFGGGWGGAAPQAAADYLPAGFTNPWGGQANDPGDYGGAPKEPLPDDKFAGPAQIDQADWTPAPDQDPGSGWQDASADPGIDQGGWDQASDDSGGWGDDTQDV